jgi:hypothetical protein
MTNRHTLRFSLFAAAILAFCLPVAANAQWGGRYPTDRYPDNRDRDNRSYGRYDERGLRDSVHRLDRLAKDFERDMDRALDRSRANGTQREDRINDQIHQFRDAVGDLKSRVGNGRDLNRSADEARRVLEQGQQLDRVSRGRMTSQWSQIQQELRYISNIYGFRYNGGYGRDDDWRRRDRNDDYRRDRNNRDNDWWRRIPFPQ